MIGLTCRLELSTPRSLEQFPNRWATRDNATRQVVREEVHGAFWELRRVDHEAESFALHALVFAASARLAKAGSPAPHVHGHYHVASLDEGTHPRAASHLPTRGLSSRPGEQLNSGVCLEELQGPEACGPRTLFRLLSPPSSQLARCGTRQKPDTTG
jgi:hypothetical protein